MTGPRVELCEDGDVVVARLAGDVDLADTATVASRILAAVSNAATGLVVDLTAVRYLDSAGIQMLFEFARQLEAGRQGMAVVIGGASPLRSLAEMTGLHQALSVCASEADAVAAARLGAIRRY